MGDDITIGVTEIVNNIEVTAQPNDQIVDISVIDNADEVTLNITPTVIEINVNKGSSYARWGTIYGNITDQTDLQNALLLKADLVDGKVPAYQLPSFVDDIIEVSNYAALPATGETGKIYVTLDNNKIYRWSGSIYIEIAANNAIWGSITGTLSNQTDLVNALNLRVPYTGATSNVNLGEYGLTGGFLGLDTTPTSTPTGIGTIYWDSANRTAALIDGDGDTTLQIGQEERILVHNNTGATLTDGQVVYITGSTGNLPSVSLANASSETTSAATLGVVTESIANGADGFVTVSGIVNGLNTLAFNEGDLLWLGTTAGTFTTTKPISPNHLVLIGYVIKKAGGNGSILVKIQNTQELEESSDVLFTSLANNQVLTYESATDLWKNKSIATILGYTPANDASIVHLAGTETITGNKTFDSSAGSSDAIEIISNSTGYGINLSHPSGGTAIFIDNPVGVGLNVNNTGTNSFGISISNPSTGRGISITNGSTGTGIYYSNSHTGNGIYSNNAATGVGFYSNNVSTGQGIYSQNNAGGWGIFSNNASTGRGINSVNASTGTGFYSINSGTGVGIDSNNSSSGFGIRSVNSSNGWGAILYNTSNGRNLVLDNSTAATGIPFTVSKNGTEKFTINDAGEATGVKFIKSGGTSSQFLKADGSVDSTTYQTALTNPVTGTGTTNYIPKFTGASAIGNSLIFDNGTNVGIGTASPAEKLDVSGNLRLSDTAPYLTLKPSGWSGSAYIQAGINLAQSAAGDYFSFQNLAGKGFAFQRGTTTDMLITSNGELCIGRTSAYGAGWLVNVEGNIYAKNDLRIDGGGSFGGSVGIGTTSPSTICHLYKASFPILTIQSSSYQSSLGIDTTSGNLVLNNESNAPLSFNTNATERMRITSGGRVLIGSSGGVGQDFTSIFFNSGSTYSQAINIKDTNASANNSVYAVFRKSDDESIGSIIRIGTTAAVAYNTTSDYRLKEDFKQIKGLDLVSKIKVYDFKWKGNESRMDGVIAHELQEVVPYAVSGEKDAKEMQQVDYSKLVPILVQAIQELKAEIEILKNK